MKILKNISQKAKTSIREKIKSSFKTSFLNSDTSTQNLGSIENPKNLREYEAMFEDYLELLEELVEEIEKINHLLNMNNKKKSDFYIIENIEEFSFSKEFETFRIINDEIRRKETDCLVNVEGRVLIKFKVV